MSFAIRLAAPQDLEGIWQLGEAFHREFSHILAPLDARKAHAQIARHLERFPGFVAERNGEIVGVLLLELQSYWYSASNMLTDTLFYVRPDARGGAAARRLVRAAAGLAQRYRCRLQLTTSSGLVGPAVDRFYAGLGLARIGAAYLME